MSIRDLVTDFESLGNNCEFGIVQRALGAEPLGLLRWAGINEVEQLIGAIEARFEGLGDVENVTHEKLVGWDHHAAIDKKFGFYFHTDLDPSGVLGQPDALRQVTAQEGRRLKFLARNLLGIMRTGEKILVYRQKKRLEQAQIELLYSAINAIGRSTLLIAMEDENCVPGTIEVTRPGLITAYLRRLSNENPPQIDFETWHLIIAKVHHLWSENRSSPTTELTPEIPDQLGPLIEWGMAATRQADWRAAVRRFEILRQRFPDEPKGYSEAGHALRHLGRCAEADKITAAGLQRLPGHRELLESYAWNAMVADDYPTAEGRWRTLIISCPAEPNGYVGLAQAFQAQRREEQAEEALRNGMLAIPDSQALWEALATQATRRADWSEALRRWRSVLAKFPASPVAYHQIGIAAKQLGDVASAEQILGAGHAKHPDDLALAVEYAWCANAREDWPEAFSRWHVLSTRFAPDAKIQEGLMHARLGLIGESNDGATLDRPPPPELHLSVLRHRVGDESDGGPLHCFDLQIAQPGMVYRFSLWVFVPSSFVGSEVSLVFWGYASFNIRPADLARRDKWQKISVMARVPESEGRLTPSLVASGSRGSTIFSAGWRVEPDGPSRRPAKSCSLRTYQILPIDEIVRQNRMTADGHPVVARAPCLPDVEVKIPEISYGQIVEPPGLIQWPLDNWKLRSYAVHDADLYVIRDAVIHGEQGIITVGDLLIEESLYLANLELFGFSRTGPHQVSLEAVEPDGWIDLASHLLCGYVANRNYAHWWVDVVPALLVPPFHDAFDGTTLVWPAIRQDWQAQTLGLLPETAGRSLFLGEFTTIGCRELRFVPKINNSDMCPHPSRTRIIAEIKRRAGYDGGVGRKIYISRRDAGARRLVNDDAVSSLLERHGFETFVLSGMPVAEQIKLFASASHVVAAHGAGLGNVLFCPNCAALCELQMTSNVQWSIRRIAAVVGMRYGCILGKAEDDDLDLHLRNWTINLADLEAVLADPAFSGGPEGY